MQMNTAIEPKGTHVPDQQGLIERRRKAVRTAWMLTAVVMAIFVLFILSGVLGN
jgi:hypothetical protein